MVYLKMSNSWTFCRLTVWVVASCLCFSWTSDAVADEFENYNLFGKDWKGTCATGSQQSPINIVSKRTDPIFSPRLKAEIGTLGTVKGVKVFVTKKQRKVEITWDRFVVQPEVLIPAGVRGEATFVPFSPVAEVMAFRGGVVKVPIEAVQFHFHTPSEEAIDGKRSAAVIHIVHRVKPGYLPACDQMGGCLVVLGVLLDLNEDVLEDNPVLKPFLNTVFGKTGEENGIVFPKDLEFNLDTLLPDSLEYVTWPGSLTTPPCTEGVLWILFRKSAKISENQIQNHQLSVSLAAGEDCKAIKDGRCFPPQQFTNNRAMHPLNDRVVKRAVALQCTGPFLKTKNGPCVNVRSEHLKQPGEE